MQFKARAETDALLWAPETLEVVTSQLLLFCLDAQSRESRVSRRFWNARKDRNTNEVAMSLKTSTLEFCTRADIVIDRTNSSVYYRDVTTLKQAISQVIDLIERYPELRNIRPDKV